MIIFRKINDTYHNIKRGLPNLIKWLPVIWKDRDWDFFFIYALLHKKLYFMEKHIRKYSHHINSDRDADQIKLCVLTLNRLIADEYYENIFRNHDKKWGESHFNWEDIKNSDCCSLHITRDNVNNEKEKEQETKEFRRLSPNVEKLKQQDIHYLFDNMKKHIHGWWD
jgi:hypothetical protein